ncbi:hypothetical protein SUGI_0878860 [Cryptomeria japonica]|nr:hypothetical protein SUGI_0878860 [Cryptomeria japonica]
MAMAANEASISVRLAMKEDSPLILKLVQQLAEFERQTHMCEATQSGLESTLFNAPPFEGPTVLLLEISPTNAQNFISESGANIVGFVLFCRNYSSLLAKPGFYIVDLFMREPYRRRGFGTILLKMVASQAVKLGFATTGWRICKLTIQALEAFGI